MAVKAGEELTARIMGAHMSYAVVPRSGAATRLLLKVVMSGSRWLAPAISVGDLVTARRQLLNLKRLADNAPVTAHRQTGATSRL